MMLRSLLLPSITMGALVVLAACSDDDPAEGTSSSGGVSSSGGASSSGGPSTTVDATQFDQTCSANTDCVAVGSGEQCGACGVCDNAAIRTSELTRFEAAVSAIECPARPADGPQCAACAEGVALCEAGACVAAQKNAPLNAADYTNTCDTVDDCVLIHEGDPCSACQCANAAIAKSAEAEYLADRDAARCGTPGACAADCAAPEMACTGGRCVVVP